MRTTILKPVAMACSLTRSRIALSSSGVRPIVPGSVALALLGVYGSTGMAMALPSFVAIALLRYVAMSVWPPLAFCGPRCSVPPV